jgi:threonine synthase
VRIERTFLSTRGEAPEAGFSEILLSALAPDGGLYQPRDWPALTSDDLSAFRRASYVDVARKVLSGFATNSFIAEEITADVTAAYATFNTSSVAPLVEVGRGLFIMELFHGPTLAFKDVALQVLGRLFARALAKKGGRATVVVATSGDTGSAAIAALGGLKNIDVFVLHPHNRVSEVQRRQMTTSTHANVHNIAIHGTFDDAQALVKALFADTAFAQAVSLTAVNSINFARIAAQAVYYITGSLALGGHPTFVVPTGNFGDILAGDVARRMGAPVGKLIAATNSNDIVARALTTGVYESGHVHPSLSPSMDIQVASNFERALFEASGRDSVWVRQAMASFATQKKIAIPPQVATTLREVYGAARASDEETLETIRTTYKKTGRLIDPHTAVALHAALALEEKGAPKVVLSTAHPAKFPDAVEKATGVRPALPEHLRGLYDAEENFTVLPPDKGLVRGHIESKLGDHEARN